MKIESQFANSLSSFYVSVVHLCNKHLCAAIIQKLSHLFVDKHLVTFVELSRLRGDWPTTRFEILEKLKRLDI